MPTNAARLLFAAYHLRVLGVLLMRPEQAFHVRELERRTGISAGTLHRELKRMRAAGLVTAERIGNQVRYAANRDCNIFPELQGILRKTVGLADVLRDALRPLQDSIDTAFIFGSFAAGSEGPYSDVDLLIVGEVGFDALVAAVHPAEQALGRPVNPVIYRAADFAARRDAGQPFLARVLREPKIVLIGQLDESREPA